MKTVIPICCPSCGEEIRVSHSQAGQSGACPGCGNIMAVPWPGIGRMEYLGWKFATWVAAPLLGATLGDAAMLLVPVFLGFSLYLAYLRAMNIGIKFWQAALVWLIPVLGFFYFVMIGPGAGKRGSLGLA